MWIIFSSFYSFFPQHILIILSPPSISSHILPNILLFSSSLTLFLFLFFKSKQRIRERTERNSTKTQKQKSKHTKMYERFKNCETGEYKTKVYRRIPLFLFLLTNYSWMWQLPWNVVDTPSETPLEKTHLPFSSKYQLQIALFIYLFWCKTPCSLPPLSAGNAYGSNLCRYWLWRHRLWVHMLLSFVN